MKLKLPPFRVTQRSTSGKVSHHILPRLCGLEGKANVSASGDGLALDINCQAIELCECHTDVLTSGGTNKDTRESVPSSSLYELDQENSAESWRKARSTLLKIVVESEALPEAQLCISCNNSALYRCLQCGPRAYFCNHCYEAAHLATNLFHTGEIWEVCDSHVKAVWFIELMSGE